MKEELQIIGYGCSGQGTEIFYSYDPARQCNNDYFFHKVTTSEINDAVEKAHVAFRVYKKKSGAEKAIFLKAIAEEIMNAGEELITVCCSETALLPARIEGERLRTVNQLNMFAALLIQGSWVDARIDTAIPERTPVAKPDLRFMHIPLGPVVVFGASNFPLAFSVAGGDTASALAAGCPVIVKAHPAHPATSAIVGRAIQTAAYKTSMPDGVFSLLFDDGIEAGLQLVKHPNVKAVGFTGSFKAGKTLFDIAVSRPEPIPVYAEMSSTNPVFVLPRVIKERGEEIAAGYAASVTLGTGQFCTNPGMLVHQDNNKGFAQLLKTSFEKTTGGVMLTPNILNAYTKGIQQYMTVPGVEQLAASMSGSDSNRANPVLLETSGTVFNYTPGLHEEIFGPGSIVINVAGKKEMLDTAEKLTGQLTVTVHGTEEDLIEYSDLLNIVEQKAGRLIINGFPTGVEVCSAMVHGGPFPSTTDSKTTSVGTAAIYRFTRPFCYQNMPQALLPPALQNKNILSICRLIDGERTTKDIIRMHKSSAIN